MSGKRAAAALVGVGVLGSQAGHLLAYQVRFGAAAQQLQSSGAHSYLPLVAKTSLGLAAVALLSGLLLVGFARVLGGRQVRASLQPSYIGLLAGLFTIQLAVFAVQEIAESLVAGSSAGSVAQLLLWGTLGQLPVAVIGALALRWLLVRVEAAVGAIRDSVVAAIAVMWPQPTLALTPVYSAPHRALLMSRVAGSSLARRGPPPSSLLIG